MSIPNPPAPKNQPSPPPAPPKTIMEKAIADIYNKNKDNVFLDKMIELDELKNNSILVFRIKRPNMNLLDALTELLKKYDDIFKEKNISTMIMSENTDLSVVDEKQMNDCGWFKKEKSNLILP